LRTCSYAAGASRFRIALNVVLMTRRTRPERSEIDAAALRLLARHGGQILATARRYAATPEDAEDACQRGLEILLTKAPSTSEEELIPWLKTVVKHEAFALRRQRERHSPVTDDGELRDRPAVAAVTHEQAERLERLRQGAEALGHLKPHEIRALVLKAEGFSYREICAMTGWSYTKVNRLLTEGRRSFLRRVSGIQRGADCARYEPLLSALADGEASAEDLATLRPHMQTCLSCRAALREFRALPERVASVLPPAALVASDGGGPIRSVFESLLGAAQHKTGAMGERLHAAAELATGQKVAAVAASAAALAGGGTAIDELGNHRGPPQPAQVEERMSAEQDEETKTEAPTDPSQPHPSPSDLPPVNAGAPPAPAPAPQPEPPPPPPDPANEFAPTGAPQAANSGPPPADPPPQEGPISVAGGSSGGGGPGSPSGSGEFAP
jgi:RNA polymerase sigma factor (sigma-70 family)